MDCEHTANRRECLPDEAYFAPCSKMVPYALDSTVGLDETSFVDRPQEDTNTRSTDGAGIGQKPLDMLQSWG